MAGGGTGPMEMSAKKRRETYRMEYTVEELSRKENTYYGKEYSE